MAKAVSGGPASSSSDFKRVLVVALALWISVLPSLSAIHLALIPHVFSPALQRFEEITVSAEYIRNQDRPAVPDPAIPATEPDYSLTSSFDCPLANLALRDGMILSGPASSEQPLAGDSGNICPGTRPLLSDSPLSNAPKHSPPAIAN